MTNENSKPNPKQTPNWNPEPIIIPPRWRQNQDVSVDHEFRISDKIAERMPKTEIKFTQEQMDKIAEIVDGMEPTP
jgi:hypothetical protein